MNEECAEHSAHLVVLTDFSFSNERMDYWEERCSEVDAHFILDYLNGQQEAWGTLAFIPGDGHWTAAAHRWVADSLRDATYGESQAAGGMAGETGSSRDQAVDSSKPDQLRY